jgi:uracil-DNA glycosylase
MKFILQNLFLLLRILAKPLAPAAHGGNTTGRIFTGDSSDWLSRTLFKIGFAN